MLQKSKSKTIAKTKYLVLVPLMLVMLTYVACSEDGIDIEAENQLSSEQADQLPTDESSVIYKQKLPSDFQPEYSARQLIFNEKDNVVKLVGEVSFKTDIMEFKNAEEVIWDKNRNEILVTGVKNFSYSLQ